MLGILMVVALVGLVLAAVAAIKTKGGSDSSIGFPYRRPDTLFSAADHSFPGVLDQAVSPECRDFGKVRISGVVSLKRGLDASARQ